jgi:hypothetical protein
LCTALFCNAERRAAHRRAVARNGKLLPGASKKTTDNAGLLTRL